MTDKNDAPMQFNCTEADIGRHVRLISTGEIGIVRRDPGNGWIHPGVVYEWKCYRDDLEYVNVTRDKPQAAEVQGWQPIETAPREKIIFLGNEKYQDYYCAFYKGRWCSWNIDDFDQMSWVSLEYIPTHWMPLPPPPEQKP